MKPIIFTGESVRAILDGRKTQTRRTIKPFRLEGGAWGEVIRVWRLNKGEFGCTYAAGKPPVAEEIVSSPLKCPFRVGSRLWVKETVWRDSRDAKTVIYDATPEWGKCEWVGDPVRLTGIDKELIGVEESLRNLQASKFWAKQSVLFMPRWASRITLEVTAVRAQRVMQISREDAKAEGIAEYLEDVATEEAKDVWRNRTSIENFAARWDVINGKNRSWASNPWVFAVMFKVV